MKIAVLAGEIDLQKLREAADNAASYGEQVVACVGRHYTCPGHTMNGYALHFCYEDSRCAAAWAREALRLLGHDIPETIYPVQEGE